MIDTTAETLLPLAQAADELPRRRRGRKTHISTLYRWSQAGCRGVRLETVQVGATRCTSREALQRFFERLSQADGREIPPAIGGRSLAQRRRASENAGRQLEKQGA
ncbi:MAG: DUF1580 domain-containing protein [Planctomycetaceae bacterium]|nr:DUF1580 domain-containing protein [Planctomycetaceae bacterium]MBV8269716.1 DUF1580 domain-containing protein [Planctomycetaceae bacterium]MBV8384999.1 DUF1580 domain-containing protein [Planctomycetaceae bacterium]MBV8557882.1 DUF1580 domain-containing protein [Planctomycetaceae bacterium]